MFASKLRAVTVAAVSSLALAACATPYGGVGVGYGSGGYYGGYGSYGGGYGGYGYDPYSYGYGYPSYGYGSYGSGGYPYGGWYDNYYYPGSGVYVYGRDGSRHRWSESQQRYWDAHRERRDGNLAWHRDRTAAQGTVEQGERTVRPQRTWPGNRDRTVTRSSPSPRSWTEQRERRSTGERDGARFGRSHSAGEKSRHGSDDKSE